MTHKDVLDRDVLDRYVADRLTPDERAAFEEHFFECDACFEAVHAEDALRRGVRHLASTGTLDTASGPPAVVASRRPAAIQWLPVAAVTLLAVAGGWMLQSRLTDVRRQLEDAKRTSAVLEREVVDARGAAFLARGAEPNVPLAILQTTRSADRVALAIPREAARAIIWIDDPPGAATASVDLVLASQDGRVHANVRGLRRNPYGAIVAGVPAAGLTSGAYVVTVKTEASADPIATYALEITRPTP